MFGEEKAWEDLIAAFQDLNGDNKKGTLFSRVFCDRTRRNGFKLKEGRFRLRVRRKILQ